jgi:hypothetical protein
VGPQFLKTPGAQDQARQEDFGPSKILGPKFLPPSSGEPAYVFAFLRESPRRNVVTSTAVEVARGNRTHGNVLMARKTAKAILGFSKGNSWQELE